MVEFAIRGARVGQGAWMVTVEGELDLYTAPELAREFRDRPRDVNRVLVDLTGATFLDSTGLSLLTAEARRLLAREGRMLLAVDDRSIVKVFEITGLLRFFELHPSVDEALLQLDAQPSTSL